MIFGHCPYDDCDHPFNTPMGEKPAFEKNTCEKCKRIFWTFHSRVDPKSWTEEGFKKVADVNEETKEINIKDGVDIYEA